MADIDSLNLKINVDAKQASEAISTLSKRLDILRDSLNKSYNTTALDSLTRSLTNFSNALTSISTDGIENLNRISKGIKAVESASTGKNMDGELTSLSNSLSVFARSMASIEKDNVTKLVSIGNAIKTFNTVADNDFDYSKLNSLASALMHFTESTGKLDNDKVNKVGVLGRAIASFRQAVGEGLDFTRLSNAADGVNDFMFVVNHFDQNVIANITSLAKSISAFRLAVKSGIDYYKLQQVAEAIRVLYDSIGNVGNSSTDSGVEKITALVKAIRGLSSKGVTELPNTIPLVVDALDSLFEKVESAPQVSDNLANLVQGLGQLAQAWNTASKSSTSAKGSLSGFGSVFNVVKNSAMQTTNNIKKVASGFLSLIQKSKQVKNNMRDVGEVLNEVRLGFNRFVTTLRNLIYTINRVKDVWAWLGKSMDMIETVNYFQSALEQITSRADTSNWKEYGYKSASDYAKAFYDEYTKQINGLLEKMTGYAVDENGALITTGMKNLGMNPNTVLQYQTGFAQIASSMGLASDTAVKMSNALTMLGADMASVRNEDFETVWQNLQSGITGMSRAVDKYGMNIRASALEEVAFNLGIEKSISNFSQAEKAILRTIVMFKSADYAAADLAETIKTPANMVRILQENFDNLARSIGNLFLPVVQKVLPFLISLTIAMRRLAEYVATLLGIDISKWGSSVSSSFDDLVSDALDESEALDDATDSANELKRSLLGFDEINALGKQTADTDSLDDANGDLAKLTAELEKVLGEYESIWNKAYENMESDFNKFADEMANAFKLKGLEGVGELIATKVRDAFNSIPWDKIKGFANTAGERLAEFFNGLTNPETFYAIGESIAQAINTIFTSVYAFLRGYDFGKLADTITSGIRGILDNVDWELIQSTAVEYGRKLASFFNHLFDKDTFDTIGRSVAELLNTFVLYILTLAQNIDFEKVGEAIKTGIMSMLTSINWTNIDSALSSCGVGLANALNKVITVETFKELGYTIARLINSALIGAYSFLSTADLDEWSSAIADMINTAVDTIDFAKAGEIVGKLVHTLAQALLKIDVLDMYKAIFEFLKSAFSELTASDFLAIAELFIPRMVVSFAGLLLTQAIKGIMAKAFATMIGESVASSITTMATSSTVTSATDTLGATVGAKGGLAIAAGIGKYLLIALGAVLAIGTAFNLGKKIGEWLFPDDAEVYKKFNLTFSTIAETFKGALDSFKKIGEDFAKGDMASVGKDILMGLVGGILGIMETITYPFVKIFNWIWNGICNIFGIHSPAREMMPLGENIILGIVEGFVGAIGAFTGAIAQLFADVFNIISTWVAEIGNKIIEWKNNFIEWINEWKENTWASITEWVTNTYNEISTWIADTWSDISGWVSDTIAKYQEWKEDIIGKFVEWKDKLVKEVKDKTNKTLKSITGWVDDTIAKYQEWKEDVEKKFTEWKENVSKTVTEKVEETTEKISGWIEDVKKKYQDWKDDIEGKFRDWKNNVVGSIHEFATEGYDKVSTFVKDTVSKIESFSNDAQEKFAYWSSTAKAYVTEFATEAGNKFDEFKAKASSAFDLDASSIAEKFGGVRTIVEGWLQGLGDLFDGFKPSFSGLGEGLSNALSKMGSALGTVGSFLSGIWTSAKSKFDSAAQSLKSWFLNGRSFSTGGFPEDGFFFANHSELVGKFNNGRTAVANNQQIIEGIKSGVAEAMMEVYMATSQSNGSNSNVVIPVYLDGKEVGRSAYENINALINNGSLKPMWT